MAQTTPTTTRLSSYLSKKPDDERHHGDLARQLLHATRAFESELIVRLARAGLDMLAPRHFIVLRALDPDQGMRASALARDAGVTRQAIGQVVAELERFDIVEQVPDPSDARAKIVRYTPFGKRGYRQSMSIFTELELEAAQSIGSRRMAALKQDLQKLAEIHRG